MNREHWKELLPIITAFANGEDVQGVDHDCWMTLNSPSFLDPASTYRIAPKPRKVWINEYNDGTMLLCDTKEEEAASLNAHRFVACHEIELPPLP
jgi:hypothetical protein